MLPTCCQPTRSITATQCATPCAWPSDTMLPSSHKPHTATNTFANPIANTFANRFPTLCQPPRSVARPLRVFAKPLWAGSVTCGGGPGGLGSGRVWDSGGAAPKQDANRHDCGCHAWLGWACAELPSPSGTRWPANKPHLPTLLPNHCSRLVAAPGDYLPTARQTNLA